ncbi:alpha/beta hydrolase family protein [Streptomyces huiliensis]|uniref:alpha/beta hydrolase family protein n=1 Tax=Streptomyces huiliensis TaxID=2876027 RepID=UPI001CBEDC3D|nr:alpha/beta hydrolase [Streptomyces huiliensis]MBZ4319068.1 alpha/beta hydrolase [Streptomyces huiliensis]
MARAATPAPRTASTDPVPLPAPSGPCPVGTTRLHLVDTRRTDPYAPTRTPRELMVQVWYAAGTDSGRTTAPYLTGGLLPLVEQRFTLPTGSFSRVRTQSRAGAPVSRALRDAPLVFYSPGRQDPAATGTAFAQELASQGYVVVGVNHTYDGPTEFPDGRVVPGNPPTSDPEQLRRYSDVRAADLRFVLDVLSGERGPSPAPAVSAAVDFDRVGAFGHSLGGSASAEALRTDARFSAGIVLDGRLQTDAVRTGLTQPFMLFTEDSTDAGWDAFMAAHRAWGRKVNLLGTRHYSFTDLAPLGVGLELAKSWPPEQFQRFFGSLDGRRSQAVTSRYVAAFFGLHLRGRPAPELDAPGADLPEVRIAWRREAAG